MKISKLFHWLYAVIMLLPIFAIGSSILISTFNMSSKEETEIHYKYETNEVNTIQDLKKNNIYHLDNFDIDDLDYENYTELKQITMNLIKFDSNGFSLSAPSIDEINLGYYSNNENNTFSIDIFYGEDTERYVFYAYFTNSETYVAVNDLFSEFSLSNLVFYFDDDTSLDNFIDDYVIFNNSLPQMSTYNVIETVETHNLESQELFYRSVDKVKESPLFSWAYDSFLVAPFSYIVALFGIPTNHVIVELLSYWLAISIIWLVFDLIMYIPLLVHRWLDKGVLE